MLFLDTENNFKNCYLFNIEKNAKYVLSKIEWSGIQSLLFFFFFSEKWMKTHFKKKKMKFWKWWFGVDPASIPCLEFLS